MTNNRWMIYNKDISKQKNALGEVDPRILKILANRDIEDPEDIEEFLDPKLEKMHDPFLMEDMGLAVDIILDAIDYNQHIHIVGDYDQDGNSAIVILMKGLGEFTQSLTYAIPDRVEDGYGLNKRLVDQACEMGADLLVTCDNGISSHEPIAYAKSKGLKVIVTDHHQTTIEDGKQVLPKADAILNPHRLDCPYPFKDLCGAGVALKLIQAIYSVLGIEDEKILELFEFACMGTICDVVDLVGENRIIAVQGLKRINETDNLGIKYLALESGWEKEITSYAIGFVLGPAINASGRLSTARLGVELFLEDDEDLVHDYASELVRLNNERKGLTNDGYDLAYNEIINNNRQNDHVIVSYIPGIHESIVGIIAGRIKDDFYRPTIIFTDSSEEGIIKGSARSIDSYNMYEKVSEIKHMTQSFGGHKMAAGMSMEKERLEEFRSFLNSNSGLSEYDLQKEISIDIQQGVEELDFYFIRSLDKLGPFGKANPRPTLADKGLNLLNYSIIGKNKNVLKLSLEKNGKVLDAISFSNIEEIYEDLKNKFGEIKSYSPNSTNKRLVDVIYKAEINNFRGQRSIQLRLEDIRPSK